MHHNQRAYDTWGKKIQLKITKSIGIIFRKQFLVIIGQKKSIEHETEWKGEESDNLKNVDKHVSSLFFSLLFLEMNKTIASDFLPLCFITFATLFVWMDGVQVPTTFRLVRSRHGIIPHFIYYFSPFL